MRIPGTWLRRFHATATLSWAALTIPAMRWWHHSLPFLVFVSVYALAAAHFSAWQGARAEDAAGTDP